MAANPDVQTLFAFATTSLEAGWDRQSLREALRERVHQLGLSPLAAIAPSLCTRRVRRKLLAPTLLDIARELGRAWQFRTVGDLLDRFEEITGMAYWLPDFVLAWADAGKPGPIFAAATGSVFSVDVVDESGEPMPVIVAFAAATSDPQEIANELIDLHYEQFGRTTCFQQPGINARRLRLFIEGHSDREIARQELEDEGFDLRAANPEEFQEELRRRTNAVRQSRHRYKDHVTKLAENL